MRMIIRFWKSVYWGIYNSIPIHGKHNIVIGHSIPLKEGMVVGIAAEKK